MINANQALKYCREDISKIENYAEALADATQLWEIHHRLEVNNFNHPRNDGGLVTRRQLIEDGMYWCRPARELIFVTESQHRKIHKALCAKAGRIGKLGTHWFNNGVVNRRATERPGPEWVPGQLRRANSAEGRR